MVMRLPDLRYVQVFCCFKAKTRVTACDYDCLVCEIGSRDRRRDEDLGTQEGEDFSCCRHGCFGMVTQSEKCDISILIL